MEILISILSGGAVVAAIEGVREAIAWRRNRKAAEKTRPRKNRNMNSGKQI